MGVAKASSSYTMASFSSAPSKESIIKQEEGNNENTGTVFLGWGSNADGWGFGGSFEGWWKESNRHVIP